MKNKILYNLTLLLLVQYIFVTISMMFYYDAGNRHIPTLDYFSFDKNYLSDLGRTNSFIGIKNTSYIFYSLTLGLVGIGVLLFFSYLQSIIKSKVKYLILFLATVSAISYIGIALYPVDVNLHTHLLYGRLAFFSFFLTTLFTHIFLDRKKYTTINIFFYILNIMLFAYVLLMFFGPSSTEGLWALHLKTIAQKVMVYGQVFLCLAILINLNGNPIPLPSSSQPKS